VRELPIAALDRKGRDVEIFFADTKLSSSSSPWRRWAMSDLSAARARFCARF